MVAAVGVATPGRVGIVHVHSDYSRDGRDPLERLASVSAARGIDFVGLTDHAEDLDAARFARYLDHCAEASRTGARLIPGLEFRFSGFPGLHLLAFGLTRWIEPATPAEFLALTRDCARFTMAAHPVLWRYRLPDEVRAGIDAVEIWNASYNTRWLPDPRAIRLLHDVRRRRPGVVGVAGLDQHDARNDRETRVELTAPSWDDPLLELRAGRFRNRGRTMVLGPGADLGAAGLMLLTAARIVFDAAERTQERTVRAWRRWRRRR